jgi:hypothetical protein
MLASGQVDVGGIAVSGGKAIWTTCTACTLADLGGTGDIGPLVSFGMAVDDTSVYWTGNSDGTVMKTPK